MSCQTAIMPCNNNNDNSKDSNNSDKSRLSILCIRTQAHPYVHRFHANLYVHIYTHLYTWAIWQINHYYFIKFVIDNVTRMLPAIYVWPCLRSVCLCVCVSACQLRKRVCGNVLVELQKDSKPSQRQNTLLSQEQTAWEQRSCLPQKVYGRKLQHKFSRNLNS